MRGLVTKSTGSHYLVRTDEGTLLECYIKGNFRIRDIRTTNPVAVGDWVTIETQADQTSWITQVQERKNYIIRRSTNLSKEAHILAANLDQALLIVTLNHPVTSLTFIDRFLATAEAYRIPAILLFNKMDLLDPQEKQQVRDLSELYQSLGYTTLEMCAKQPSDEQMQALREQIGNKVTLLAGNSGVGKSTLINTIFGKTVTRTGIISDSHDKGVHTTTFSQMYELCEADASLSGQLIDIPGIKGFGAVDMTKQEISHYFREIFAVSKECKYSNCLHMGEPDCAVEQAVEQGRIALSRYESYISLLGDCSENKYR